MCLFFFFFQAEDGIRDLTVTGVQTCALPISLAANTAIEFSRNRERYAFLRWGQTAFRNFSVVPPNTGIVHQVNLEYLGRVIFDTEAGGTRRAYPDTLVGTDPTHAPAQHPQARP